jgi:Ca-activated chloride channel family protein
MKSLRVLAILCTCSLGFVIFSRAQDGPNNSGTETVARKKKSTDTSSSSSSSSAPPAATDSDQPKIPSQFKKDKADTPATAPAFSTDAVAVTVEVSVMDNRGHFIPKIPREYFRIMEDNVPQKVATYSLGEAPMTICMLIEFSNRFQQVWGPTWRQTLTAAYSFAGSLRPDDHLAIVAYDLKPEMLSDFTTDRNQTADALQRLNFPGFSESNMFDALVDTAQRMENIEGRKAILLISTGIDTFSKLTFDKARRGIQEAGVPVYTFGLMQSLRDIMMASRINPGAEMDFLQADNQMRTFATESGGMSFFPHFQGEFGGIFQAISQAMRQQYVLTYTPSNQARDGKYRKIKVEIIDPKTNEPLRVVDDKNKPLKYSILAKSGYTAPRPVE